MRSGEIARNRSVRTEWVECRRDGHVLDQRRRCPHLPRRDDNDKMKSSYQGERYHLRSISSSLSGLLPKPFFKLSVARCLSSSSCLACRAGAVFVSSKMWRFLRSCSSGRVCKCFSRLLRRSAVEIGEISTPSEREGEVMEGVRSAMVLEVEGLCGCHRADGLFATDFLRIRGVVICYVRRFWEPRWKVSGVESYASSGEGSIVVAKVASWLRYLGTRKLLGESVRLECETRRSR
jgi:hypothetical protein